MEFFHVSKSLIGESRILGSQSVPEVSTTCGLSELLSSLSVGGLILRCGSPFLKWSGRTNPSGVVIDCVPPAFIDLSSTLTPKALICGEDSIVCPLPMDACWWSTTMIGPRWDSAYPHEVTICLSVT